MEMIIRQLQYFLASFAWGTALMFFYDFVLVFRRGVPHSRIGKLLEDWIFWMVAAIFVFQMIFALNNGILRSFFVVSFVSGLVLYRRFVSRHVIHIILIVIHTVSRPYVWIRKKIRKMHKKSLK